MVRGENHPLEEMLDNPHELDAANDNVIQVPPPVPQEDTKTTYRKKREKTQEPPPLPEIHPEDEEEIARKNFFKEQKKIIKEQKNKKRSEAESKKRDEEERKNKEEKEIKEFHKDAHEEIARKNFFKKAKGEKSSDEEQIIETRNKINDLDLSPNEKEMKLEHICNTIREVYGIHLDKWANPEGETDKKEMKRLGDILKGKNPENINFLKRLFGGISEKDRMKAKSFKNDYDAYATLADEIAEATQNPRRGKKKKGLGEPLVLPPKYQWI